MSCLLEVLRCILCCEQDRDPFDCSYTSCRNSIRTSESCQTFLSNSSPTSTRHESKPPGYYHQGFISPYTSHIIKESEDASHPKMCVNSSTNISTISKTVERKYEVPQSSKSGSSQITYLGNLSTPPASSSSSSKPQSFQPPALSNPFKSQPTPAAVPFGSSSSKPAKSSNPTKQTEAKSSDASKFLPKNTNPSSSNSLRPFTLFPSPSTSINQQPKAKTVGRNYEVPQSSKPASSQVTYLGNFSTPPASSSSSSKPQSFQPPALSAPFKYQPKPVAVPVDSSSSKPAISSNPPKQTEAKSSDGSIFLPKNTDPSSANSLPPFKPTLFPSRSTSVNQHSKASYVWVEKGVSSTYKIPKNIKDMIENNIVPRVLKEPLSPSTYVDYFATLLYAEDFYIEQWSEFLLENVELQLEEATVNKSMEKKEKRFVAKSMEKEEKRFITFEVDSVPERRPFLLSRDFVFAKSKRREEPFQGILYRVVKSTKIHVEFGEDFYSQHHSGQRYDISFSFNRVCLKRAHQAIAAASDVLFQNFLFPDLASSKRVTPSIHYVNYKLNMSAVQKILNSKGSPPYLIEGPRCISGTGYKMELSETGIVVKEAILELYLRSPEKRILVCAPINRTLDFLLGSLKKCVPETEMFRANAAFRATESVTEDIWSSCLYNDDDECFACPKLQELKSYKIIFATFVSAFRLHNEGITAGHFSHIFLVDASSATEPEAMIALANLANDSTSVVVMGERGDHPGRVRSDIGRRNGLRVSYYERLRKRYSCMASDLDFTSKIEENVKDGQDRYSFC